jgi:hypothetical protein
MCPLAAILGRASAGVKWDETSAVREGAKSIANCFLDVAEPPVKKGFPISVEMRWTKVRDAQRESHQKRAPH